MYPHLKLMFPIITCLLSGGCAGIWPFYTYASTVGESVDNNVKQVAIIGAGAAGSSVAYYLQKFATDAGLVVNITVFEKSAYVGGRSTTVNAYDDPLEPVELGASIFVEVNTILKNASTKFGLNTQPHESTGDEPELLGIWNGEKFVYTQKGGGWVWWDTAKLLWKYGLAPVRTKRLMQTTVGKFMKLYEPPFFPFRSLSERALDLGLSSTTGVTGNQLLTENNIGPPFTTDIIQASTRVNYGQNLGFIHGLETMVCMAIDGAMQVKGGNWQIFDQMIKTSSANLLLNTSVNGIRNREGKYILQVSIEGTTSIDKAFDIVVLAAPLQFSGIDLQKCILDRTPDEIPYVKLHVTLFASPLKLSAVHFKLKEGAEVPTSILTTLSPEEDPNDRQNIVGKSGFFSISTLKTITNPKSMKKEYLYKIFSPKKVTSELLGSLLGTQLPADISTSEWISWYYPHVWHSYPYEFPRVTFEDPELARGFYYTSGIESFISTMETSALMGMNVAQLIMDDYYNVLEKVPVQSATKSPAHGVGEL